MLSICHNPVMVNTQRRKHGDGDFIFRPLVVKKYNQSHGGVDRADQQLHFFVILRKS